MHRSIVEYVVESESSILQTWPIEWAIALSSLPINELNKVPIIETCSSARPQQATRMFWLDTKSLVLEAWGCFDIFEPMVFRQMFWIYILSFFRIFEVSITTFAPINQLARNPWRSAIRFPKTIHDLSVSVFPNPDFLKIGDVITHQSPIIWLDQIPCGPFILHPKLWKWSKGWSLRSSS